ncbi:MAG: catalase [Agathobacter sp.]|nr:catalase [Agathobacter sp.]
MKVWQHFRTITAHKILVMKGCFQIGLYKQGILHDLSKYGPTEFLVGCKYYKGYMSPNNAERYERGYSSAWLHHKGKNKHHLEYWIDYGVGEAGGEGVAMCGMKMPIKYVAEMFIDRVSASKNYQKEKYTDRGALDYYNNSKDHYMLHPDTRAMLEYLLEMLWKKGEKETFAYVKTEVLKGKVPYEKSELEILKNAL